MYTSSTFESDLMNSYAWDTAIVFLQAFDDRKKEVKTKPNYSQQNSLNTKSDEIENTGTNNLADNEQDEICNIWDMASNCNEWTTESKNLSSNPCVSRGGCYNYGDCYASTRFNLYLFGAYGDNSFRPLLIV